MKAVVLAAGRGTRLQPLTDNKPKGLVEVDGKPILTHCFERLREMGAAGHQRLLDQGWTWQRHAERLTDIHREVMDD